MLALDPPGNPTIGACLAANLSGPRRHRYGTVRDLVIGDHRRARRRDDRQLGRQGGEERRRLRPRQAVLRLGGAVRADRARRAAAASAAGDVAHARRAGAATRRRRRGRSCAHRSRPSAVDVLWPGRLAVLIEGSRAAVDAQFAAAQRLVGGEDDRGSVWEEAGGAAGVGAGAAAVRAGRARAGARRRGRGGRPRVGAGSRTCASRSPTRATRSSSRWSSGSAPSSIRRGCSREALLLLGGADARAGRLRQPRRHDLEERGRRRDASRRRRRRASARPARRRRARVRSSCGRSRSSSMRGRSVRRASGPARGAVERRVGAGRRIRSVGRAAPALHRTQVCNADVHRLRRATQVRPRCRALAQGVPVTEISRELISDCVHCGFCLPTCPTYGPLWREEMDSPRGRIYLMGGLVDGTIPLSATTVEHFDRCLGCMACVTVVPVRRAVRPPDRADARAHRGALRAAVPGAGSSAR